MFDLASSSISRNVEAMDKPDQLGAFDPQDHATLPPACWQAEVERVLITEEQIAQRVRALSAELTRDFAGRELVVVAVLNGTIMFLADLIRHLSLPMRL